MEKLTTDEIYAEKLRRKFQCVLVDEFQDNNNLNYAIIKALNPEKLMVIGDKNQSIYAFRGAYAGLVESYIRTYENVKLLKLEENYRSGQEILDMANQVISSAALALVLKSGINYASKITTKVLKNIKEEATFGAHVIQNFLTKYAHKEVAILCRSGRAMLPLEFLLRRHHINYKKYGGVALTDSSEIKDFLAILRILNNPKDSVAIMRALCLFPGIGETFASRFAGLSETESTQISMELGDKDWPPRAKELKIWIEQLEDKKKDLGVLGKKLYDLIEPFMPTHYPEDFADRLLSLQGVVGIMVDEQKEGNNLSEFLEVFVLDKGFEKEHPTTHITLSTIHSAKGLEWDGVLVFNAAAQTLPSKMSKTRDDYEEERRLTYVAITRARKSLVISANYEQGGITPFLELNKEP